MSKKLVQVNSRLLKHMQTQFSTEAATKRFEDQLFKNNKVLTQTIKIWEGVGREGWYITWDEAP